MNEFEIQRELISIEERMHVIKRSFAGYVGGDETAETKNIDAILKKVRTLQNQMRKWFAPDPK